MDKILDANKKSEPTSEIEQEIDRLVYHLYGLTYEVLVIDSAPPFTWEEYEREVG